MEGNVFTGVCLLIGGSPVHKGSVQRPLLYRAPSTSVHGGSMQCTPLYSTPPPPYRGFHTVTPSVQEVPYNAPLCAVTPPPLYEVYRNLPPYCCQNASCGREGGLTKSKMSNISEIFFTKINLVCNFSIIKTNIVANFTIYARRKRACRSARWSRGMILA